MAAGKARWKMGKFEQEVRKRRLMFNIIRVESVRMEYSRSDLIRKKRRRYKEFFSIGSDGGIHG